MKVSRLRHAIPLLALGLLGSCSPGPAEALAAARKYSVRCISGLGRCEQATGAGIPTAIVVADEQGGGRCAKPENLVPVPDSSEGEILLTCERSSDVKYLFKVVVGSSWTGATYTVIYARCPRQGCEAAAGWSGA